MKSRSSVRHFFYIGAGIFLQNAVTRVAPLVYGSVFFFPALLFFFVSRMSKLSAIVSAVLYGMIIDAISSLPFGIFTSSFLISTIVINMLRTYVRYNEDWIRFFLTSTGLLISTTVTFLLRIPGMYNPSISVSATELLMQGAVISVLFMGEYLYIRCR
jgi:cell shape-determining protein MreD